MRKLFTAAVGGFVGAVVGVSTYASAQDIRIGAMREGSSWYVFAATLEGLIEPQLGDANVEIIARGGGIANPMVVQNGDAEVALANVATSVWAANGHELYQGASAPDIRALVGGLNSVYMAAMVTNDFVERTGLDTLEAILSSDEAIRVIMKPAGSSAPPTADMIMEALGTSRDEIIANGGDIIQVETAQIPQVIRDGGADLYFDTVLQGHPVITEVTLTGDVRFLDLPQSVLDHLAANGLAPAAYGPWFDNQTEANMGADFGTVLIANASLPDEVAYAITRTLIENADAMGEAHAAWAGFNPEAAWRPENTGVPLHPGAEQYYRERGWIE
ncbi:MAG: TAXI family TRAP transporter solute-binding subunit [Azospirillaceae bacterium]